MKTISEELNLRRFLPSLTMGLVTGLLEIVLSLSFAALICTGDLSGFVAQGIGLALFSCIVVSLIVALFSSLPGTVAGTQDVPAAILVVMVTSISATMPAGATAHEGFITAVTAIALTTLITGLFFLGLGQFKLSGLIRFLPYPVVGGFLAGTGWLLVTGAIGLMADVSVSMANLPQLLSPEIVAQWLPGIAFAVLVLLLTQRFDHFLLLPGLIGGSVLLFFVVMALLGNSTADLSAQGWFLGPFPAQSLYKPLALADLAEVNWLVISRQAINAATIVLISTVALLLNATGLEITVRRDVDLNREMQIAGFSNLIAGLGSGLIGYHQLSLSALNIKLSKSSRLSGLFAALLSGIVLLWGASVLSLVPTLVVGGLLFYLGLTFLQEWIVDAWRRLPKAEYAIVLMILVMIAAVGFLEGVALGILLAGIMFVVSYSRTDLVRHELSGKTFQSRVTRSPAHRDLLDEVGDKLYIAQLQGFIFFGTADKLLNLIRQRLESSTNQPVQYLVLDFRRVIGLDSTALLSFQKLIQLTETHQCALILTEVSAAMQQQMVNGGVGGENGRILFFPDLDLSVEWCEEALLRQAGIMPNATIESISDQLAALLPPGFDLTRLLHHLEQQSVAAGETIMQQGDAPEFLFFLESGQVTARLERAGLPPVRLETMRNGRVVGEIGFYLAQNRTASIVADEPSTLYRLSLHDLQRIEKEDPEAASLLHRLVVHLLAERVTHLVKTVDALQQ